MLYIGYPYYLLLLPITYLLMHMFTYSQQLFLHTQPKLLQKEMVLIR